MASRLARRARIHVARDRHVERHRGRGTEHSGCVVGDAAVRRKSSSLVARPDHRALKDACLHMDLPRRRAQSSARFDMYGFTTTLTDISFNEALERTTAALKAEGFGVLSDIDVQRAMKEKVGAEMPPYRILGACNPPLAHQALQAEPDIGLLLPCNVIVREESPRRVVVGFLDPQTMFDLVGTPGVKPVADQAESRLRRVCAALEASSARAT